MSYNYCVSSDFSKSRAGTQKGESSGGCVKPGWDFTRFLISNVLLMLFFLGAVGAYAQTTLISPSKEGGFENGTTFQANGWTVVNGATNKWFVGSASTPKSGTKAAFISNNDGVDNAYTNVATLNNYSYFYRDVVIPAGQTRISLSFKWKNVGEANQDGILVYSAPTSFTPKGDEVIATGAETGALSLTNGAILATKTAYTVANYFIPAQYAGSTLRLIFAWKNNTSLGANPPASIDEITLVSSVPKTFQTLASGDILNPATWVGGEIPSAIDNIVINAGHNLSIGTTGLIYNDITVNGTVSYPTSTSTKDITFTGNMTIAEGGVYNMQNDTRTQRVTVAGNIINNGTIKSDIGGSNGNTGSITLNGTQKQTVSGSGSWSNYLCGILFNNTSTSVPSIDWLMNTVIGYSINFTKGSVNLGTNKMTLGSSTQTTTAASLTAQAGSGFLAGSKFSRYFIATEVGSTWTAGADPAANQNKGLYPFMTPSGEKRWLYLNRNTTTTLQAGELSLVYTDDNTITQGLSIADGATTINYRLNSNWKFTNESTATTNNYNVCIVTENAIYPLNGNSRIMLQNASLGTPTVHENGTILPSTHRNGFTEAILTGAPLYVGLASADSNVVSVKSGDWEDDTVWNTGQVPVATQPVTITKGNVVAVNSPNSCKNLTVVAGGSLELKEGSELTLSAGENLFNTSFINNGTVTVQSGSNLTINGYLTSNAGSTFIQNGGNIKIDGNSGASDGTGSVPTGTRICFFNNSAADKLQLNAGNFTIVDPHYGSNIGSDYAIHIQVSGTVTGSAGKNHNLIFGDGVSTAPGNSVNGFMIGNVSSKPYHYGNIIVNTSNANNRFVRINKNNSYNSMIGNLTVNQGGEFWITQGFYLGGNVINNGTITFGDTTTGKLAFALSDGTSNTITVTNAQSVSGSGIFRNLTPSGLNNQIGDLIINNSSAEGVTLNVPLSMAGVLTLTKGKLNTTATNILTMGSILSGGGIVGGSATSYVNGPMSKYMPASNANTSYSHFPIGTSTAYAPIWMAPTTTVEATVKAQAFDSNTGTADPSIINLTANRRWEMPVVSGAIVDANIKLGDANLVAENIAVMAPSAAGVYNKAAGDLSVFTAAAGDIPNTIGTTMPIVAANYTGFISYADTSACSGTPNPGNTIASSVSLCLGQSVSLSLQNQTPGSGLTYAWQSSTDGTNYTNITGATLMSYVATPQVSAYYRCVVTCATGNVSKNSTPVLVSFSNMVGATGSAFRCGYGNVSLTAAAPAGTIKWYDAPIGGNLLGTGSPFTTPNISQTTTFYAASESSYLGDSSILPQKFIGSLVSTPQKYGTYLASTVNATIKSIDIYPATVGLHTFTLNGQGRDKFTAGNTLQTYTYTVTAAQVASGSTTPITIPVNFTVPAGAVGYSINCDLGVYYSSTANTYSYPYVQGGFSVTGNSFSGDGVGLAQSSQSSKMSTFNWVINTQLSCSGARVPVTATVTPSPAITIDQTAPVTLCFATPSQLVKLTSPVTDYDTYTWSPATGVTGNATIGWTFNSTVTTTYTLVASKANGCAAGLTLVVNSGPTGVAAAQTLATGSTVANLTPAPCSGACVGGYKWYADNTTTTALASTAALTTNTTYWVSVSPTGACESPRIPVLVTLGTIPPTTVPAPTAAAIQGFCNTGTLADLVVTGTTGAITWYDAATGGNMFVPFSPSGGVISKKALASGITYYVTQTVNYLESARTPVKAMNLSPTATGSATQTICVSGTVADLRATTLGGLDGTTAGTVKWYDAATGGTVLAPTTPLVNNTHYFAAHVNGTCESTARFDVTAIVNAAALTPTFTQVAAVCQGATMTALPTTSSNNIVGTWAPALNNQATTLYTFTPASGSCNTATMTITVNVVAAPTATAQTKCAGATVADLTPSGAAIKWYSAATGGTALATTTALTATTYYASQTVSGCESVARQSSVVTLNTTAQPTAAAQTVCGNAPTVANLVATGTGSNVIKWYSALTGGTALTSTTALATGTYYVTQTDATTGCESTPRKSVVVTVPKTAVPTGAAAQVFCTSATVANLAATGTAVKWYADATTTTALNGTTALVNGNHYFATQTLSTCESASRLDVTVTINANSVTPTFDQIAPICQGGTFTLPTTSKENIVGTWAPAVNNQATTPYVFTPAAGCATAAMTVTVNVTAAPATAIEQAFCNAATVANLIPNGLTYKWYAAATGGSALASATVLTTATSYYVSQIDATTTCESVARTKVNVTVNVTAAPTAAAQSLCTGAHVSDLVATGVANATFKWYVDATTTTALNPTDVLQTATYYVSQINPTTSCESATRTAVVISVIVPGMPGGNATQSFCNSDTVLGLVTTSTNDVKWYETAVSTTPLTSDTPLVDGQKYYATQTILGCESASRLEVTAVNLAPVPTGNAQQTFCAGSTVADLTTTSTGTIIWYDAATGGNVLAPTTVLVHGLHYYASQTVSACESDARLDVTATVNTTLAPTGDAQQTYCAGATVANLVTSGTGTITWYDAATEGNVVVATTVLVNGTHYFASQILNGCESIGRLDVTATVNTVSGPTATSPQVFTPDATIANIAVTGSNVQWYASSEVAIANGTELPATTVLEDGKTYYAMQTVDGCRSIEPTAVLININLGVDQFEQSKLQYYPNPVTDMLNVSHTNVITSISMFNLLGQHIMTVRPEATSTRLDMSTLPIGTYMLQVEANGKTTMAKVIKNQ